MLVLTQNEPRAEFDEKFKEIFGLTFTEWTKTATVHTDPETIEYEDGLIYAGMTTYDSGFKVYSQPCVICGKPAVRDYNGHEYWVCKRHFDKLSDEFDEEYK